MVAIASYQIPIPVLSFKKISAASKYCHHAILISKKKSMVALLPAMISSPAKFSRRTFRAASILNMKSIEIFVSFTV